MIELPEALRRLARKHGYELPTEVAREELLQLLPVLFELVTNDAIQLQQKSRFQDLAIREIRRALP